MRTSETRRLAAFGLAVLALADALDGDLDPGSEAAVTLIRLGHAEHPAVQRRIATSPAAEKIWQTVNRWELRRG